ARSTSFDLASRQELDSSKKVYFFFQAEDGIRDRNVTGVQTCALPISLDWPGPVATCSPLTPAQANPKATAVTIEVSAISIMPGKEARVIFRTKTSMSIAITIATIATSDITASTRASPPISFPIMSVRQRRSCSCADRHEEFIPQRTPCGELFHGKSEAGRNHIRSCAVAQSEVGWQERLLAGISQKRCGSSQADVGACGNVAQGKVVYDLHHVA